MIWAIVSVAVLTLPASAAPGPPSACPQATDGNTIARVQSAAEALILRLQPNPYYGGAWFEYRPCYRIVLTLTDDRLRRAVRAAAPEHLRPYIGFARAAMSHAQREAAGREIREALGARRIVAVFIDGGPRSLFRIGVRTEEDATIARSLIPDRYRSITVVVPGGYAEPIPERSTPEPSRPRPAPGEYVGPSAADEQALYPRRATLEASQLQLFVVPFGRQVRELPGFSDLYIEHEPSWHVVVAFAGKPPPLEQVKALASPVIRDRIIIRTASRTQAQITADLETIAEAFRGGGLGFAGGYDVRAQRFDMTVATQADRRRALALVPPSLRGDVDVTVGSLPVPE